MVNTFIEYEQEAMRTAPTFTNGIEFKVSKDEMLLGALGLVGEAGEYADYVKKHLYHGHVADREKVLDELGDVLWYLAHAARRWSSSLGEVAEKNNLKLRKRYPEGFSKERSVNRAE